MQDSEMALSFYRQSRTFRPLLQYITIPHLAYEGECYTLKAITNICQFQSENIKKNYYKIII